MLEDRRTRLVLTLALCLVYIIVRVWRLTDSCLWFDEIFSIHAAEHSWDSLFWFVAQDLIHPPLSYILLKLWIGIGGDSLLWLRLFPVLFAVAALVPFIYLCSELKLKASATLLALALFAVNGSLIKYSQEVRMYAPLLCLSLFSIWLFARFYFRGKNIWILTLINVLLIYTHYFGWFVIASEVAMIFIFQRVKIRHVLIMSGIALVAFVPWLIAVARAASGGADVTQNIGWMTRPGLRAIFDFAFDAVEPFYFQQSSAEPTTLLYITIPLLLIIAAATILYLINWKTYEDKSVVYLMSVFILVPLVLAFVVSWIAPVSIWGARHLIIVFPPIAILSAIFITSVAIKPLRFGLMGLTVALFVVALVVRFRAPHSEYVWCAWNDVAVEFDLTKNRTTDERLYAFEDLAAYHLWFGLRNTEGKVYRVRNAGLSEDLAYFLPRGFESVGVVDLSEIEGEWVSLAFRAENPTETDPPLAHMKALGYSIESVVPLSSGKTKVYVARARKLKR